MIKEDIRPTVEVGESGFEDPDYFEYFAVLFHVVRRPIRYVGGEIEVGVVNFPLPTVGQHLNLG